MMPFVAGVFFFFFQAEDGIRDYKVTGVQTCALPISLQLPGSADRRHFASKLHRLGVCRAARASDVPPGGCVSGWTPHRSVSVFLLLPLGAGGILGQNIGSQRLQS